MALSGLCACALLFRKEVWICACGRSAVSIAEDENIEGGARGCVVLRPPN